MRKQITFFIAILFVITSFVGCNQFDSKNDLIIVDVTKSYPVKEITLQDFLDVEYIPLETTNEFITNGVVMALGNKLIIVKNWKNDGNIFVFDRNSGKALRKINRMGRGPEEYLHLTNIVLDEVNNEIFINCILTSKIFVYDLFGNFIRDFNHSEDARYKDVHNYDNDHLICYNELVYYKEGENRGSEPYHMIISKQDGSIFRNISIPFDIIRTPVVYEGGGSASTAVNSITPYYNSWLLVETSSDTVYNYIPKKNKLIPFLVKKPTKDPVIFLTMGTLTDRFYFLRTKKIEFDFSQGRGFPIEDLMFDKQENAVFKPIVINDDFAKRKTADMTSHPVNNDIAAFQNLEAYQLVDAYKNDELKGRLKEIASELNMESNPVIMVMKYKN